jgi:mono/diheme cytochrome c family protein
MEWKKIALMFLTVILITSVFTVILATRKEDMKIEVLSSGNAKEVFIQNCASCHGRDGSGSVQAKSLRGRQLDPEYIKKMIQTGNTVMPKFHFIRDSVLADLAVYVHNMK